MTIATRASSTVHCGLRNADCGLLVTAVVSLFLAACTVLCAAGCRSKDSASDSRPVAVATNFAYYDALRAIGGPDVNCIILLLPRQSPHEYEPAVQDLAAIARAKLIVKNGMFLDAWIDKPAARNESAIMLDIGQLLKEKGIKPIQTEEVSVTPASHAHAGHAHEESPEGNPHIWLDPRIQAMAAEAIRDALVKIDPAHAKEYQARAKQYLDELARLDNDFAEAARHFKRKDFIGFHSAYAYLADRYGLNQVAAIEELPGQGPGPVQQGNIIKLIKAKGIKVIFMESALPAQAADRIVEETGVKTGILQPLETYDDLDQTYVSLMRENLKALQGALD